MSHSYRFIKNSSSHLQTREWTLQGFCGSTFSGTPRSRFNVAATETAILSMSTAAMTARRICLKARTIISCMQSDCTCESFSESLT
ncbi:hypothetical protein IC582_027379 [Cucumis melo]